MTLNEILDYKYHFEDADAEDLRGYFYTLLFTLYSEGEGFSGKRPFGNSCWEYDIYYALVQMGAVEGTWDDDEYTGERWGLKTFDREAAEKLTFKLIAECFYPGSQDD